MVEVSQFSSQIPLQLTAKTDEPQCRGTIHYVFEVRSSFSNIKLYLANC